MKSNPTKLQPTTHYTTNTNNQHPTPTNTEYRLPTPWRMPLQRRRKQVSMAISDARHVNNRVQNSSSHPILVFLSLSWRTCLRRVTYLPIHSSTGGIHLIPPNHHSHQCRISLPSSHLPTQFTFGHSFTCYTILRSTIFHFVQGDIRRSCQYYPKRKVIDIIGSRGIGRWCIIRFVRACVGGTIWISTS